MVLLTAGFSYSLYLVHFPVNNFIVSWIGRNEVQVSSGTLLQFTVIIFGILVYAWPVAKCTEERTRTVRAGTLKLLDKLNVKLQRKQLAAASSKERLRSNR